MFMFWKRKKIRYFVNSYSGSSYQIGFAQGKRERQKNPWLRLMLRNPVFPKTTKDSARKAAELFEAYAPNLLTEMRGFSDATGISFDDVVVKIGGYGFIPPISGGCSQIALLPAVTSDNHMLVGRNYDFSNRKYYSDMQLLITDPDDGNKTIGTSQFFLGRIEGMNEHGLYAGISLAHGKGKSAGGLFSTMIVRMLLNGCGDLEEALRMIHDVPHSSSYNFLIADPHDAVAVEVSPPKSAVRKTTGWGISVTNHYRAPEMEAEQKSKMPNSFQRETVIARKLNNVSRIDRDDLASLLSGHAENGVCLHYYRDFLGTIWSGMFDLTAVTAFYAFGAPCRSEYAMFDFNDGKKIRTSFTISLPRNSAMNRSG
jgi:predicted choloylglycine hydrolase